MRTDLPPALKARRGILVTVLAFKLRKERGVSIKVVLQGVKVVLKWKEKGSTCLNVHVFEEIHTRVFKTEAYTFVSEYF